MLNLGYTNIGNNAKPGQGSAGTVGVGMDPGTADTGSSTTDTSKSDAMPLQMAADQGTLVSQGLNG